MRAMDWCPTMLTLARPKGKYDASQPWRHTVGLPGAVRLDHSMPLTMDMDPWRPYAPVGRLSCHGARLLTGANYRSKTCSTVHGGIAAPRNGHVRQCFGDLAPRSPFAVVQAYLEFSQGDRSSGVDSCRRRTQTISASPRTLPNHGALAPRS